MRRRLRIGIGGLSQECCTFSPLNSTKDDFTIIKEDELLGRYGFLSKYPDIEFVGLLRARATPGGSIERSFYDEVKKELLNMLTEAQPLGGILLDMHGASKVAGLDDAEGDLIHAIGEAA